MPNNLVLAASKGSRSGSRTAPTTSASATSTGAVNATGSRSGLVNLGHGSALGTLIFGKASRVFAAFVSFHYLQDRVALPLYLFFVGAGASLFLLLLQRPWNGRRIGARRARKVLLAGAVLASTLYIWTAGLRSAGPLRTMLIDGAELPLLYLFAVISRREAPEKRRTRGAALMLAAYLLLIWDASGSVPELKEIERTRLASITHPKEFQLPHLSFKHPQANDKQPPAGAATNSEQNQQPHARKLQSVTMRRLLGTYKPPVAGSGKIRDAFIEGTPLRSEIGVVLVLIASLIMQSSRSFTRRLSTELGGAKRHFALSISCATMWLAPLALLSSLSSAGGAVLSLSVVGGITTMRVSPAHAFGFAAVGFLWLVVPYYVRAIRQSANCLVLPEARAGSWILIAAFVLNFFGISLMMAPGTKRALSELPIDSGNSTLESRPPTAATTQ